MTQQPPTTRALTVKDKFQETMAMVQRASGVFSATLPPELSPERFIQIIHNSLARNPRLLECTPYSIVDCAKSSAELGLELNSPLGHAYMVPFFQRGKKVAVFVPGYKGLVKLMLESPRVVAVRAKVVYDGEKFEYEEGLKPILRHWPQEGGVARYTYEKDGSLVLGGVVASYAVIHHVGGLEVPCVMFRGELEKLARAAKTKARDNWTNAVWNTNPDEMLRKSPVRRAAKLEDLSAKLARAVSHDEEADRLFAGQTAEVMDPEKRNADLKERIAKGKETPVAVDAEFEEEPT